METMGDRIKRLRIEMGLTQEELGKRVGLKRAAINKYEKGNVENMKRSIVEKMSSLFSVSPSYLMALDESNSEKNTIFQLYNKLEKTRQERVYRYTEQQLHEQENEKVSQANFNGNDNDIDVAGKVAAGLGTQNFDKTQPLFTIRMNKEDIPSDYDLALQVTGDSMEPTFEDGEIIFVKEQDEFQNGMIAAVEINEEAFIKKIYKEESRIRLVSLNRDTDKNGNRLYPDFYADEKDELYLIGRVVL
ncbi:helix-turn-helix transcriptional regulator [Listeria aquatica]|uniref:Helix-turn-helix transcriptional regulator n=1 Tax=Listeria aquatica TaxID=1494960 RepID=A0A841ZSS1_9LIST|nr:XRE family transcriptional regulator [Listeria aquatica]MBC1522442.1 helix-turn-helix transcriptional regulator [Listeria aquatica]